MIRDFSATLDMTIKTGANSALFTHSQPREAKPFTRLIWRGGCLNITAEMACLLEE